MITKFAFTLESCPFNINVTTTFTNFSWPTQKITASPVKLVYQVHEISCISLPS